MTVSISFIVPAFNESEHIEVCLRSILVQVAKYKMNAEIIVVNNGSTDTTAEQALIHTESVFTIERSTVSTARNFGISMSSNEVIAFIDGDVELTNSWGAELVDKFDEYLKNPLFVTGSQCIVPENGTFIERDWFGNLKDRLLGGANIVTSKASMKLLGGFDDNLPTGEDYDLCRRAKLLGLNYSANPHLTAIHLGFPRTVRAFAKREMWHGEGDFHSIYSFFKSPVAILSVLYVVMTLIITVSVFCSYFSLAVVLALFLLSLNLALTLKRFWGCGMLLILRNTLLNFIYFYSRFFSLFRLISRS